MINNEEERVPSYTSLHLHWLHSCWVSMLWTHATSADVYSNLPKPETSGWAIEENGYKIKWEDNEVQKGIKENLTFLTKGCHCKKGCKTNSCGCRKKKSLCGPSCECHNCNNITQQAVIPSNHDIGITNDESTHANDEQTSSEDEYSDDENWLQLPELSETESEEVEVCEVNLLEFDII